MIYEAAKPDRYSQLRSSLHRTSTVVLGVLRSTSRNVSLCELPTAQGSVAVVEATHCPFVDIEIRPSGSIQERKSAPSIAKHEQHGKSERMANTEHKSALLVACGWYGKRHCGDRCLSG